MSDEATVTVTAAEQRQLDAIAEMNDLHVQLGRKAAELAMSVLESVKVEDITVASAVSLLRFGIELERKALLGSEDDEGDEVDPFDALAKQLTSGQTPAVEQKEE